VRIIPQDLGATWNDLRRCFAEQGAAEPGAKAP
jgi:hypothetical protein